MTGGETRPGRPAVAATAPEKPSPTVMPTLDVTGAETSGLVGRELRRGGDLQPLGVVGEAKQIVADPRGLKPGVAGLEDLLARAVDQHLHPAADHIGPLEVEIVPVQARALARRRAVGPDDVGEIAAAGTGLDPEIAVFQVRPQPGLELMLAGAMGDESLRRLGHGHLLPVPAAARPRRR